MRKTVHATWLGMVFLLAMFALIGCGSVQAIATQMLATPTLPPIVPETGLNTQPAVAATPSLTATSVAPTATATRRPVIVAPRPTATPPSPPGVYVIGLAIDNPAAKSNDTPVFTATFLNTTGQTQTYTWYVKIFSPDQPSSFGETAKVPNNIPPGIAQFQAAANWKTRTFFGCLYFTARAFFWDTSGQINPFVQAYEFLKPDGSSLVTAFSVCP